MKEPTMWHDLRTKPPKWKDVLVMTYNKSRKYRICHYSGEAWYDSYSGRSRNMPYRPKPKNTFRVKRWAYLEDIDKLFNQNQKK